MVMLHAADGSASGASTVLAALLRARTGQELAANRQWRIDVALRPLLQERGLASLEDLVALLLGGRDHAIGDRIVEALLNGETSFFRDPSVFELAAEALAVVPAGLRPRVWSAGCASGQEALSLAMRLADLPLAPEIVATDVSAAALDRARVGRFTPFEIQRGLPVRQMLRWFDGAGEQWVAKPELLRRISWRRHNLVADRPPPGSFDLILCRNVLFYLAPGLRAQVLDGLANALRPSGLLILGAGETVIGMSDRFAPSRRFRGCYEISATTGQRAAG